MKNDLLANRHIGISKKDEEQMLRKIGVSSLDELIDKTIPANIRLKEPLALPEAMTEYEFGQHIAALAAKNKLYTTYIGMGWYNTVTPAVIQRNVFENPVWYIRQSIACSPATYCSRAASAVPTLPAATSTN